MRFTRGSDEAFFPGRMIDLSSQGAAFFCRSDESCPARDQRIDTHLSVPRFGAGKSFERNNYVRSSRVWRVDELNESVRAIAVRFSEPLPFKPGEQGISESEAEERLEQTKI